MDCLINLFSNLILMRILKNGKFLLNAIFSSQLLQLFADIFLSVVKLESFDFEFQFLFYSFDVPGTNIFYL